MIYTWNYLHQVQFSDQLPGGPLTVQVYSGASGAFEMFGMFYVVQFLNKEIFIIIIAQTEDDGETNAYEKVRPCILAQTIHPL